MVRAARDAGILGHAAIACLNVQKLCSRAGELTPTSGSVLTCEDVTGPAQKVPLRIDSNIPGVLGMRQRVGVLLRVDRAD